MMNTLMKTAGALALAAGLGTSASASTVDLTWTETRATGGSLYYFGAYGEKLFGRVGHFKEGNYDVNYAGAIKLTADGVNDLTAWCIEVLTPLVPGTYEAGSKHPLAHVGEDINKLFSVAYDTIDTAVEAVAFQTVLWELTTDTDQSYDLLSGDYILHPYRNGSVFATAQGYLDAALAADVNENWKMNFYTSPTSQNLVVGEYIEPAPVPLPASGLMLLAGVAGLAAVRRNR